MNPLGARLIAQIEQSGPMSISNYMQACLLDPDHGYYTTRDPFGAAGDFTTAPEISQMFGELIGLALAQAWLDQGAPSPFTLAELGPGRGTLMADILRATKNVPGFHAAIQVWLIEASPHLRKVQTKTLAGYTPQTIGTISGLPQQPLFIIANEFFDALPIRQFIRTGNGWRERLVETKDGALNFTLGQKCSIFDLNHRLEDTRDGDLVEICKPAADIMAEISARISPYGGAALAVDYGDWRSLGDTFQALENHASTDALACPGQADLTAHVDFEALTQAAAPLVPARLTTQGVFLERLGITDRARALANQLTGDAFEAHITAHKRLTHSDEMGTLFKVLALTPKGASPIAGTMHDA